MMDLLHPYIDLFVEYGARLSNATLVSIKLLVISATFGFLVAIPVGISRTSTNKLAWGIATVYSAAFRGTPFLVQLFMIYYGLAQFGTLRASFLWVFFSNAFFCAALALTLNLGAYMAEHVRAGILSIPFGEVEAAQAFGVGPARALIGIIIPRALKVATPALTNEIIVQLKATALASTITVVELTGLSRRLSAQTYTLDPFVCAAVIYGSLTLLITIISRVIEHRGNRYLSMKVEEA